jgi:hypothetical protein
MVPVLFAEGHKAKENAEERSERLKRGISSAMLPKPKKVPQTPPATPVVQRGSSGRSSSGLSETTTPEAPVVRLAEGPSEVKGEETEAGTPRKPEEYNELFVDPPPPPEGGEGAGKAAEVGSQEAAGVGLLRE